MSEDKEYIVKKTIYAGKKFIPFKDGTKIFFHFQTKLCDQNKTLIDDSRKMGPGDPLHIVLGKKFKLEVWEAILQKMALQEVAQFTVDKSLVMQYPFVSKTLREMHKPKEERHSHHHCAMALQSEEGIGHPDLNQLLKNPQDLEFTMEIVSIQQPEEYDKEIWQMDETEQLDMIPKLKAQGNEEYSKKNFQEAAKLYAKAIGMLEQLMIKEKPHDIEWNKLNQQKLPILLNFAQCKLIEGDYYSVITYCTEVLRFDKDNVKAYFRRAKAHIAAWNPKEAREDLDKVMELDKSLEVLAKRELLLLEDLQRDKDLQDKDKLKKMFT
ncbi:unnamed protein product [Ceutorhynchus assimilis]|uniref:AIP/AIPL N-terminal FKBP-type PPIase domain-containing protein n=1 Tax=Ceutorhynchus assimilis TaxID=467358 RepID=A0A9N9MBT7_9CUCU|nr:unnamed protein product [Ceutorhynchus assimilis]